MNKKNLILGGILIALIAVAYLWQGPIKTWQQNRAQSKNFLAGLEVDKIGRIEIFENSKMTVLEKAGDKWKVGGTKDFYVKDGIISQMISSLKEAVKAEVELVGANIEKKSDFNTDESGAAVKFLSGETVLADFIIGKLGSDFQSTYISLPGSNKTYALKANLNSAFSRGDWYDRTIFATDREKINKIRFQYPAHEFTIEKEIADGDDAAGKWSGIKPYRFSVDEEKINKILDIMSNLQAVEIPEQNFDGTGLEKNLIIVEATGEEINNTIMIGDSMAVAEEEENQDAFYYVKKGDSDNIYLITKEQRDELEKKIWELR